jgi:hypothetical protein
LRSELVGHDCDWSDALLLQNFPHQLECSFVVLPRFNENIQDLTFTVHGAPDVQLFAVDADEHFVEMPAVLLDNGICGISRAGIEARLKVWNRCGRRQAIERVNLLPRVVASEPSAHARNIGGQRSVLYHRAQLSATASILRIESFAAKSDAEFLGVLWVSKAVDDPPLVLVENVVVPLAHRQVEAEGIDEPAVRTPAFGCRECDLMRPAAINRGGSKLALPPAHEGGGLTDRSPGVLPLSDW